MALIWGCYKAGFRGLLEPRFRQTALIGAALSLVLLFALYALLLQFFMMESGEVFEFSDGTRMDRLGAFFSLTSVATAVLILSVFLMAPVASLFTGLHLEAVADVIESRHYPMLPPVSAQGLESVFRESVNYGGLMVLALISAFVIFALAGPVPGLLAFWGLGAICLSREYVTMILARRPALMPLAEWRKRHRLVLFGAGLVLAVLLSVPLLNLVMPVIGVAAFTHLAHALHARHPQEAAS